MKWPGRRTEVVDFGDIDPWLEGAKQSLFRNLDSNSRQIYGNIKSLSEKLKQDAIKLKNAEPKEKTSDYLRTRGPPNRDKMAVHLNALIEKISVPEDTDYKTVLSFYRDTSVILESPFGKMSHNIRYVNAVFPEETKTIMSDVKKMRSLFNQLISPLKGKENAIENLEKVRDLSIELKGLISELEKEKERLHDEEKSSELRKKIDMERQKSKAIEESEDWKRYMKLEKNLFSLKERLKEGESEINGLFFPLNKTLSLLKKEDETGKRTLLQEERETVLSILSSPIKALSERKAHVHLSTMKGAIKEDPVLNESKKGRALRTLDELSKVEFSSKIGGLEELKKAIKNTEKELSDTTVFRDIRESEKSVESLERELIRAEEENARSGRHVTSVREQISEEKRLLSELLESISGRGVDLIFEES